MIFPGERQSNGYYSLPPLEHTPNLLKTWGHHTCLRTPVMRGLSDYLHEGWQNGTVDSSTWLPYDSNVMWTENVTGELLGLLVFGECTDHTCRIMLGWVKPDWRGLGIYDHLFAQLVAMLRVVHITTITAGTLTGNRWVQQVFERQGRRCTTLDYEYTIPAAD